MFLEVGEGCGLGDRDGAGLAGLPGGNRVAASAAREAVDQDGVEVSGLVAEAYVDGQGPACPGNEAPGGEVVDAEECDVAFAWGGAEVAADAPFDDPGGEPCAFQGGGCQAGLGDSVRSFGRQDAGAVVRGRGAVCVLQDSLDAGGVGIGEPGDHPGAGLAEVAESDEPPGGWGVGEVRAVVLVINARVPQVQGDVPVARFAARGGPDGTEGLADAQRGGSDRGQDASGARRLTGKAGGRYYRGPSSP